jgi:hypothetical protein
MRASCGECKQTLAHFREPISSIANIGIRQ